MFNSNVWRSGAVDVNDGIGLTRHGMIQDLVPSTGLIIDFDYPEHHADLIPFSQCTTKPLLQPANVTKPKSVEVLLQRFPDQPWYWYPSKLLAGSLDTYAFVEIDCNGEILRDVVPLERVRPMRKDRRFWKYEVELPEMEEELMAATKETWFLPMWNSVTETVGVKVDDGRLTYVAQQPTLMAEDVVKKHIRTIVDEAMSGNNVERERCPKTSRGQKRTADGDVIPNCAEAPDILETINHAPGGFTWDLPVDILLEIFSFLDVDDQIHSRAVCTTWNSILTSVPASLRVQIDLSESNNEKLASALHKMVTPSTKILVLTGSHNETAVARNPFRIVCDILKAKHMKVETIAIARGCIWACDLLYCSREHKQLELCPAWKEVCEHLVLEGVEVCAVVGCQLARWKSWRERGFQQYRDRNPGDLVLSVSGRITVGKEEARMEILDLFEAVCPKMSRQKRTHLVQMWRQFGEHNAPAQQIRQRLLKAIRYWQPSDPQPGVDAEWSTKKLRSLREVTRYAVLFQCAHDKQIRLLDIQRRQLGIPLQAVLL